MEEVIVQFSKDFQNLHIYRFFKHCYGYIYNSMFSSSRQTVSKSTGSNNKKYGYYHRYNSECKTKVRIPKNTLEKMFLGF